MENKQLIIFDINTNNLTAILNRIDKCTLDNKMEISKINESNSRLDQTKELINESLLKIEATEGKFMSIFQSVDNQSLKLRNIELELLSYKSCNNSINNNYIEMKSNTESKLLELEAKINNITLNMITKKDIEGFENIIEENISLTNKISSLEENIINQQKEINEEKESNNLIKNDVSNKINSLYSETRLQNKTYFDKIKVIINDMETKIDQNKLAYKKVNDDLLKITDFIDKEHNVNLRKIDSNDIISKNLNNSNIICIADNNNNQQTPLYKRKSSVITNLNINETLIEANDNEESISNANNNNDENNNISNNDLNYSINKQISYNKNSEYNLKKQVLLKTNSFNMNQISTDNILNSQFNNDFNKTKQTLQLNNFKLNKNQLKKNSKENNLNIVNITLTINKIEDKINELSNNIESINKYIKLIEKDYDISFKKNLKKPSILSSINNISNNKIRNSLIINQDAKNNESKYFIDNYEYENLNDNKVNTSDRTYIEFAEKIKNDIIKDIININLEKDQNTIKIKDSNNSLRSNNNVCNNKYNNNLIKYNHTKIESNEVINTLEKSIEDIKLSIINLQQYTKTLLKENELIILDKFHKEIEINHKNLFDLNQKEISLNIQGLNNAFDIKFKEYDNFKSLINNALSISEETLSNLFYSNNLLLDNKNSEENKPILKISDGFNKFKDFIKKLTNTLKLLTEYSYKTNCKQENIINLASQKLRKEVKEENFELSSSLKEQLKNIATKLSKEIDSKAEVTIIQKLIDSIDDKFSNEMNKKVNKIDIKNSQNNLSKKVSSI